MMKNIMKYYLTDLTPLHIEKRQVGRQSRDILPLTPASVINSSFERHEIAIVLSL